MHTYFQWSVYPTYSTSDQQQIEAAEKARAGRSEVLYDGCNVGRMLYNRRSESSSQIIIFRNVFF